MAPFLLKAIDPPDARAVTNALSLLRDIGALTPEAEGEELTPLGVHLSKLPVDPRVGKMLLYGAVFGCLGPVLTIASSLAHRSPFVMPLEKKQAAEVAAYFGKFDEAEKIYREMDRRDLALQLRINLGDWFKVVSLLQQGGGDDEMLRTAWNNIGDHFMEHQMVAKAAQHYAQPASLPRLSSRRPLSRGRLLARQ